MPASTVGEANRPRLTNAYRNGAIAQAGACVTMLGLIALLGIIVNNAILLIDEIDTQRDSGLPIVEAIVASCRSRLRPIIMTTCTTIIGLGPLAVAGGAMWSSMAWAMMFGLGFATLLTLMLCPVLFFLFFRRQEARTESNT